jgi:hypothetical protein
MREWCDFARGVPCRVLGDDEVTTDELFAIPAVVTLTLRSERSRWPSA